MGIELKRVSEIVQDFLRDGAHVGNPLHFINDHNEFIAADPPDRIRIAHTGAQTPGHLLQQLIAHRVSEAVVEVFEAIQIKKEHGHLVSVPPRPMQSVVDAIADQQPVG